MGKYLSIVAALLLSANAFAQDSIVFRNFKLVNTSYAATTRNDSFATKKYILINRSGDSLFLFQQLPLNVKNGKGEIYELGLTEIFTHLRIDSVYTIIYKTDEYGFLTSREYLKHRKIDFLFKKKSGASRSTYDPGNTLIIHKVVPVKAALKEAKP